MLTTYRRILAVPGALLFSATGLVGRLPISMQGLGIVLLVVNVTGSYAYAGAVAGATTVANAAATIFQGRALDRLGQFRVLPALILTWGAALALLIAAVHGEWPRWSVFALAIVAGLMLPPVGTCVRARWSYVLDEPREVQTAYALESVIDEAIFIIGPTIATVLATRWHPWAGLGLAVLSGLVGISALASQRSTQPPPQHRDQARGARPAMPWARVVPLAVVCVALGSMFAAAEVSTVAFSSEQHAKSYAGVLLALWALGSLIAGLATGTFLWKRSAVFRVQVGTVCLALVMLPMSFVGSMPVMAVALFVAGFAIAPTMIASMGATEQMVPASRLTEGIAIMHTGIAAGLAPGAALAGLMIDAHGASTGYLVALGAGVVAALASQVLRAEAAA
jgi:predicted MFS family arabinose efflux permease